MPTDFILPALWSYLGMRCMERHRLEAVGATVPFSLSTQIARALGPSTVLRPPQAMEVVRTVSFCVAMSFMELREPEALQVLAPCSGLIPMARALPTFIAF